MNKMDHKVHTGIYWTILELKGLLEDEDSCVYYERHKKHIGIHPSHVRNVTTALGEILNSRVNSYDPELKGLLLAYKNPALLSPYAGTLRDTCYIHMDIEADFYIFRPEVGHKLKGIVNKKGLNHIGVLVHKIFIVSIPQPEDDENWPGNNVNVGQEVRFTVSELDFSSKLPYIRGVLHEDEYLEGCKIFNMEITKDEVIGSPDRKRKIIFNEDFIPDPSTASVKKRKRITFDSDSEEEEENLVKPKLSLNQGSSQPEGEDELQEEDQKPIKKKTHKKARISRENSHTFSASSEDEGKIFKTPLKKPGRKSQVSEEVRFNFDSEEDQKPTHLVHRFTEESENLDEDRQSSVRKSKKRRKSSDSRDEASSAESEGSRENKHKKKKAKFSQENLEEPSLDLEDRKPVHLAKHKNKYNEKSESRVEASSVESERNREKKNKKKAKFSQENVEEPSSDLEDRNRVHLAKHKSKYNEKSESRDEASSAESEGTREKKNKKKAKFSQENVEEPSSDLEDRKPSHLLAAHKNKYERTETRDEASSAESEGTREKKNKKKAELSQENVEEPSSDLEDRKPSHLLAAHKNKYERTETRDEASSAESEGTREKKNKKKAELSQENVEEPSSDLEDRKPVHLLAKHQSKLSEKSDKRIKISENDSDLSSFESSQEKKKSGKKSKAQNLISDSENVLDNESQQINGIDDHKKRKSKNERKSEKTEFSYEILSKIKEEPSDDKVKKEPSNTAKSKAQKIVNSD